MKAPDNSSLVKESNPDVDSADKMIVIVFANEKHAYQGVLSLKELDAEGSLTLYAGAVLAKDLKGKVSVKEAADLGPVGTLIGLATGSLVGLIGGPVGVVVGGAAGAVGGSLFDLAQLGLGGEFLADVAQGLAPGNVAVIAEVVEAWTTPLDARMEALGGTVLRRPLSQFIDAQIAQETVALKAELAQLKADHKQAVGAAKARIEGKIQTTQKALRELSERVKNKIAASERERKARIDALQQQAALAKGEIKERIRQRIAETQSRNDARKEKLGEAWRLVKEAAAL